MSRSRQLGGRRARQASPSATRPGIRPGVRSAAAGARRPGSAGTCRRAPRRVDLEVVAARQGPRSTCRRPRPSTSTAIVDAISGDDPAGRTSAASAGSRRARVAAEPQAGADAVGERAEQARRGSRLWPGRSPGTHRRARGARREHRGQRHLVRDDRGVGMTGTRIARQAPEPVVEQRRRLRVCPRASRNATALRCSRGTRRSSRNSAAPSPAGMPAYQPST